MEDASIQGAADFALFTRRIHAPSVFEFGLAMGILAGFSLVVAVVFSALGAWLILPFAGLEAMALYCAFCWVKRHAQDSELLVIRGNTVLLEVREAAQTRRYEFNCAWVRLVVEQRAREAWLVLRSQGRDVQVGRYLTDSGRQQLARELKLRLTAR